MGKHRKILESSLQICYVINREKAIQAALPSNDVFESLEKDWPSLLAVVAVISCPVKNILTFFFLSANIISVIVLQMLAGPATWGETFWLSPFYYIGSTVNSSKT